MANVFLVNPISSPRPTFSLGLATLDAIARGAGHWSAIIQPDFRVPGAIAANYITMEVAEALAPYLSVRRRGQADILGISVLSDTFAAAREIARWAKEGRLGRFAGESYQPIVVAGGHLPTLLTEDVLREVPWFDYAVLGEAEEAFPKLLRALDAGRDPRGVPGIVSRDGDTIRIEPPGPPPDLDALPLPRPEYLDGSLGRRGDPRTRSIPIEVQRGCPGSCVFCDIAAFYRASGAGRGARFKSVARVLEAMRPWVERGRERFFLYSDSVLSEPEFLDALATEIEREGFPARLSLSSRPDDVLRARDVLERVGRSPRVVLERIEIGFEADSANALRLLGKGTTPEMNREVLALLDDLRRRSGHPIEIDYDFILLSHPDIAADDLEANVRFAAAHIPDDQEFAPAPVPYPKTPLWELLRKRGLEPVADRGYVIPYDFTDAVVQAFLQRISRWSRQEMLGRLRDLVAAGDVARRLRAGDW
ncbi:MAG: B12-binding domain-containing radical SAM protein [Planctomycetes bacterium]|nr:B12-binding domain-containing radical SAM protein [Planctomycetota bacterium]